MTAPAVMQWEMVHRSTVHEHLSWSLSKNVKLYATILI